MPDCQTPIVDFRHEQQALAAAMMARAFDEDPMSTYLFPDPARRHESIAWMMGTCLRYASLYGRIETTARTEGVAAWVEPGYQKMTFWRMFRAGMLTTPLRFGWTAFRRFLAFGRCADRLHEEAMPGPHWYLFVLAVDPSCQRRGLGGALLAPGLARADRQGLPVYLETTVEANVDYYARHGFDSLGRHVIPTTEFQMWSLARQPRPVSDEA